MHFKNFTGDNISVIICKPKYNDIILSKIMLLKMSKCKLVNWLTDLRCAWRSIFKS